MNFKKIVLYTGVALLVLALGHTRSWAVSFEKDIQPVFTDSCVKCHGHNDPKADLDLSDGNAYQSMVNVPSAEVPTMMRVKPGDTAQSYLWLKLQHTAPKGSGMPKGMFYSKRLPEDQLSLIKSWIDSGAKADK
jgi:hypothetical protein